MYPASAREQSSRDCRVGHGQIDINYHRISTDCRVGHGQIDVNHHRISRDCRVGHGQIDINHHRISRDCRVGHGQIDMNHHRISRDCRVGHGQIDITTTEYQRSISFMVFFYSFLLNHHLNQTSHPFQNTSGDFTGDVDVLVKVHFGWYIGKRHDVWIAHARVRSNP